MNGCLYAVDAITDTRRWQYRTGDETWSSPTVADGMVYLGHSYLYAVDAATGTLRWKYRPYRRPDLGSATVADGVVYLDGRDNHLYAVDAATGELGWKYPTSCRLGGSPAVANGVVYLSGNDEHLYAVDAATGELRWKYPTGCHIGGSPAVADGVIYLGDSDNHLYAVDAATGKLRWTYSADCGIDGSPAVADGVVYLVGGNGVNTKSVYAVDAVTGTLMWCYRNSRWRQGFDSVPAVVDGIVYVVSDCVLYAINAATGHGPPSFQAIIRDAWSERRRNSTVSGDTPQVPDWRVARTRFDQLRLEYAQFECDSLAVLRLPALTDVTVPSTSRFVEAFAEAQALDTDTPPSPAHCARFATAVDQACRAWQAARDAAHRIRLARIPANERTSVQRAIRLLTLARDYDHDAERTAAYTLARAELAKLERNGTLTLPPAAAAALDAAARSQLPPGRTAGLRPTRSPR